MATIDIFLGLLETGGPYLLMVGLVLYAIYYLVKYVKNQQDENRSDIKGMQEVYRKDISELLDSAKLERAEQRLSIEKMNDNTTKAISELNKTVGDLTLTVNKMEILFETKIK